MTLSLTGPDLALREASASQGFLPNGSVYGLFQLILRRLAYWMRPRMTIV